MYMYMPRDFERYTYIYIYNYILLQALSTSIAYAAGVPTIPKPNKLEEKRSTLVAETYVPFCFNLGQTPYTALVFPLVDSTARTSSSTKKKEASDRGTYTLKGKTNK